MSQVNSIVEELISAANEEDWVGTQQDFYHSELLRKAAEFIQKNIPNTIAKLKWTQCANNPNYYYCTAPATEKFYSIAYEDGKYYDLWDCGACADNLDEMKNKAQEEFEAEIREAFE